MAKDRYVDLHIHTDLILAAVGRYSDLPADI
jgi:hypothetical protein